MRRSPAPTPSEGLAFRVSLADLETFEVIGRRCRDDIVEALGADWTWEGKRVLDFGCGVGRLLRYLTEEAEVARIDGCDMHAESIEWCRENLDPPFHFFLNGPQPPLEGVADETYDLITAVSVFTHLSAGWSDWISELQRVTKPGGLLVATFNGPGMANSLEVQSGVPYLEEEVGMACRPTGEEGTFASIFHSRWWLETHWGRAFEPVSISPDGFAAEAGIGHGLFVGRKRDQRVSAEELERVEAGDSREVVALQRENAALFAFAQGLRERAEHAEISLARKFVLTDSGARRMLMRSFIGGDRLRRIGSMFRERGKQ